ncbi:uncharacterized protein DSM5745_00457 [Aspergillus mulundensis]|uniref:Uncharacterized protein n=1 Tax=Aspergillus mulundensis TaxID=1810919 RepID=A0A3D8T3J7_9EURO|nr:hypothetical protein DSM5745_00457 [Aspergillus mulundensis]RDW93135.1 hypothetical protein DSM5745_00457 [Aspergillus mulundensis]
MAGIKTKNNGPVSMPSTQAAAKGSSKKAQGDSTSTPQKPCSFSAAAKTTTTSYKRSASTIEAMNATSQPEIEDWPSALKILAEQGKEMEAMHKAIEGEHRAKEAEYRDALLKLHVGLSEIRYGVQAMQEYGLAVNEVLQKALMEIGAPSEHAERIRQGLASMEDALDELPRVAHFKETYELIDCLREDHEDQLEDAIAKAEVLDSDLTSELEGWCDAFQENALLCSNSSPIL